MGSEGGRLMSFDGTGRDQPRKIPTRAKLGWGTLESKMNAVFRATRH